MSTLNLKIDGMHCGACVRRVDQALNTVPGIKVEEVRVGAARVSGDAITSEAVLNAVNKAGYAAHVEG